jgi:hypothetical protein
MDLVCYLIDDHPDPVNIRPSRDRRKWMDRTSANRCLPLLIANAHGWEIRCPVTFEAEWNGGSNKDDVQIIFEDGENSFLGTKKIATLVESHFGHGILTFDVGVIISTSPGYDLWVTGPVNEFKDGIQALSAVIESYWMPFKFTMNWKFTRPNLKVRFEKGEPFCFFFPIEHGLPERFKPVFRQISEDPDLEKQYKIATGKRSFVKYAKILKGKELKEKDRRRLKFQGWYMRGQMPDGTEIVDHKKCVELKSFEMAADKGTTSR